MKKHPTFKRDYLRAYRSVIRLVGFLISSTMLALYFGVQVVASIMFVALTTQTQAQSIGSHRNLEIVRDFDFHV